MAVKWQEGNESPPNYQKKYPMSEEFVRKFKIFMSLIMCCGKRLVRMNSDMKSQKDNSMHPRYIVVVGLTCARKTTVVNGLRTLEFSSRFYIPKRFITRPQRPKDDVTENEYCTMSEFENRVASGEIFPYWERRLGSNRIEKYGFEKQSQSDNRIVVLSANNAFLRNINPTSKAVLADSFIVLIQADYDVRVKRLMARSPHLPIEEIHIRMNDSDEDIIRMYNPARVDTSSLTDEESQAQFISVVSKRTQGE